MFTKTISDVSLQCTAGGLTNGLSCFEDFLRKPDDDDDDDYDDSAWIITFSCTQGYSLWNGVVFDWSVLCLFGDHRPSPPTEGSPCEQNDNYFHLRINPLNPELNPICYLLALLAHHFLHVSRVRVKSLTLRLLMSYIDIYIWSTYSWCF